MCCSQITFSDEGLLYCSSTIHVAILALLCEDIRLPCVPKLTPGTSLHLTALLRAMAAEMSDLASALNKMEVSKKDATLPPEQKEKEEKASTPMQPSELQRHLQIRQ